MTNNTTTTNGTFVRKEERTYHAGSYSYFGDLLLADFREDRYGKTAARERLLRHEREVQVETRAVNATYADPPLWLVEKFATYPRPDRVLANAIAATGGLIKIAQRPGFNSVNVPRLWTGTSTAIETPGSPVSDTDVTDAQAVTAATGPAAATSSAGTSGGLANSTSTGDPRDPTTASRVVVIAGQEDIPLQLIEQSGPGLAHMDQVLYRDLTADYDAKLETQLINGTGGTGPFAQLTGLLNVTGTNTVTYTDSTPTATEMFTYLGQAIAAIGKNRKRPPRLWLMTTSRFAWLGSSEDQQQRPLMITDADGSGNFNLLAVKATQDDALPTGLSGNPGSFTTPGTQDVIIACRPEDMLVWEVGPKPERLHQELVRQPRSADPIQMPTSARSSVAIRAGSRSSAGRASRSRRVSNVLSGHSRGGPQVPRHRRAGRRRTRTWRRLLPGEGSSSRGGDLG